MATDVHDSLGLHKLTQLRTFDVLLQWTEYRKAAVFHSTNEVELIACFSALLPGVS